MDSLRLIHPTFDLPPHFHAEYGEYEALELEEESRSKLWSVAKASHLKPATAAGFAKSATECPSDGLELNRDWRA